MARSVLASDMLASDMRAEVRTGVGRSTTAVDIVRNELFGDECAWQFLGNLFGIRRRGGEGG